MNSVISNKAKIFIISYRHMPLSVMYNTHVMQFEVMCSTFFSWLHICVIFCRWNIICVSRLIFPHPYLSSCAQYWCYICSHDRYLLALINPIPYPYLPSQCVRADLCTTLHYYQNTHSLSTIFFHLFSPFSSIFGNHKWKVKVDTPLW